MKNKATLKQFQLLHEMITKSRARAFQSVNYEQLNMFWQTGAFIHARLNDGSWGEKVVDQFVKWLKEQEPGINGFDRRNIYRMREFFLSWEKVHWSLSPSGPKIGVSSTPQIKDTVYQEDRIVATLSPHLPHMPDWLGGVSWSHHLAILSASKDTEERFFYLLLAEKENYTLRELRGQIKSGLYERQKLSQGLILPGSHPKSDILPQVFRDKYIFEFLDLPEPYLEADLKKALIAKLRHFILELGKDFIFIAEEFRLKVGMRDFYIDLLFYHRELQCLVAFELKIEEFEPEHLGKLDFYLEALDRDVKKLHENPSIGVLLCKTKDRSVVEYAMSRNISASLISEYETKLINKKTLQRMLQEWSENMESYTDES